jgi:hypothetical protein
METLSPTQFKAIRRSIDLGRILQKDHPEIAELYRRDNSLSQIARALNIASSNKTARTMSNHIN